MRYLSLIEIIEIHERLISVSGGSKGIRDFHALESALAQPLITFDSNELYPDLVAKAAALGFFLISNHPFIDGNKRVGHAAMEILLIINGYEIEASIDEQERMILNIAMGKCNLSELSKWLRGHLIKKKRPGVW